MSKCTPEQAVAAMEYWLDYYEKASNSYAQTRAKSAFSKNKGSANYTYPGYLCGVQAQPWCAAMVTTAILEACGADKTAAKEIMYGVFPYVNCAQVWDAAPDNKKYWSHYQRFTLGKGSRTDYRPKPGDIIIFTDNGSTRSHTGMVYAVDSKYVYTIEGNSGNMCRKRSYLLTSSYIYGWIRPQYAASTSSVTTKVEQYGDAINVSAHVLSKGCAGPEVETLQILLNAKDNAGLTVDGELGPATKTAVEAFQKKYWTNPDGIVGAKTWPKLLG